MGAFLATYFWNRDGLPTQHTSKKPLPSEHVEVEVPPDAFVLNIENPIGLRPLQQQVDTNFDYRNF